MEALFVYNKMFIQMGFKAVFGLKCPRCKKGDLFNKNGLIVYSDMLGMPERCSSCDLKYELEPGFWLGALWTSYPLVILLEMPFLISALILDGVGVWISFIGMVLAFLIAWPLLLRLGRSFWIHVNIRAENEDLM